ncbi:ABC transporter permease [Xanthomonas albilineans]|uniref:ABC transporter permease n=1 Tax=Xanthomonas albilineans (strain GPE PC73 / CFBP 7063) TaxID=380358 RepID=D2UBP7_XANAP|nr:hypothetical protein [Xanthomonas albilineans]QHQ27436.1 hypothetical protein XaFJ1_GM000681 [Xanthomonas albilineans]CBA15222.1 conserved hypothetical protein [Xanthomonas albilineans GPE PC73]
MNDSRVWSVAKFEFLRFFDFRGEVISLLILMLLAALRFGGEAILNAGSKAPVRIATSIQGFPLANGDSRFHFEPILVSDLERKKLDLKNDQLDGILLEDAGHGSSSVYTLLVHRSPNWTDEFQKLIQAHQRNLRIQTAGLSMPAYERINESVNFDLAYIDAAFRPKTASVYGFAIGFIVLTMLGVIGCLSMLVQGIAGEKFGRISEMVLTALPAQIWLDGKVIAATLHGLKTIVTYAIYTSLAVVVMGFVKISVFVDLLAQSNMVGLLVLICILGLCFWNCFFALIAAILPSEQSAIRNILPILPISFLLISLSGAKHPQSEFLEFLSIFPPSSMAAMPVRLLNGAVPTLDVILALIFSVMAIVLLRFFAGRVFVYATISAGSSATIFDYIKLFFRKSIR